MNCFFKNKSQGEIFGIALLFVVIIVGVLVYSQIKSLSPNRDELSQREAEYEILAQRSLDTILGISTGCIVENGKDTVQDLINYCLDYTYSGNDPTIECSFSTFEVKSCEYALDILNESLHEIYNNSDSSNALVGSIPFVLNIDLPSNSNSLLSNVTITNFGEIEFRGDKVDFENYRGLSYKKATSGLVTWATSQRNVELELALYYR